MKGEVGSGGISSSSSGGTEGQANAADGFSSNPSPSGAPSPAYRHRNGRSDVVSDIGSPSLRTAASGTAHTAAGAGGLSTSSSSSSSLMTERPAVVEEVVHEGVMSSFDCLRSSAVYGVVGCVVAAVSREPFQDTEGSPKVKFTLVFVCWVCRATVTEGRGEANGEGLSHCRLHGSRGACRRSFTALLFWLLP